MSLSLAFFGAAGTVTGSRFLLDDDSRRILVDCGLFQGLKEFRLRNWVLFPFPPSSIDDVLLTHAHIDHSGYLPALVRDGFAGRVRSSHASVGLCEILLRDRAFLQEKDAACASTRGSSKHAPAKPLYTVEGVEKALARFSTVPFCQRAAIDCEWDNRRILFSGDFGRFGDEVMLDPEPVEAADYLVLESTCGDRRHDCGDPQNTLSEIILTTTTRGGTVVIPVFAIDSYSRLAEIAARIVTTNTVRHASNGIDLCELVAATVNEALRKPATLRI